MLPDTQRRFLRAVARVSPTVEKAFRAALEDMKSTVQRDIVDAALRAGDIEGVIRALNIQPEFFDALDRSVEEAYRAGGVYQAAYLSRSPGSVGGPLVFRFSGRHTRAEAWASQNSANLVREITRSVETSVRQFVVDSLERELGSRFVTQSLLGNKNSGGVLGLTRSQSNFVTNAVDELSDPRTMGQYLDRNLRDRRFDSTVKKAIRDKKPLTRTQISQISNRYQERLLARRAKTIAITETSKAMNAGRMESAQQLIDSGRVPPEAVTRVWDATPGGRTRDSHAEMEGQRQPWGQPFVSPVSGDRLMHPHDTSLGAGPGETINCRCTQRLDIDWVMVSRTAA